VGQIVSVRVLEVNETLKRISLSMKSLRAEARNPHKSRPAQKPVEKTATIEDLKSKFNLSRR
jgi:protein Tex